MSAARFAGQCGPDTGNSQSETHYTCPSAPAPNSANSEANSGEVRKPERPICKQCEFFRFQKADGACGWEAYCTARSRHGRMIAWQYGLSYDWTRKELKDYLESRICPAWCPKWRKEKMNHD